MSEVELQPYRDNRNSLALREFGARDPGADRRHSQWLEHFIRPLLLCTFARPLHLPHVSHPTDLYIQSTLHLSHLSVVLALT